MPKLKPGTRVPTLKEDVAINAGIKADRDNPEWNDADFARAKPAVEFFDAKTMAALVTLKRRPGERGPQKTPTKERISIRLSHDVVETFRASGEGWQTRIDEALRDYVAKRSVTPGAPVRRRSARAGRGSVIRKGAGPSLPHVGHRGVAGSGTVRGGRDSNDDP